MKKYPKSKFVHDIQVFLRVANFHQRFIQGFSKIAGFFTSIFRTTNPIGLLTILQLLIDVADKDEFGKRGGNEINLSNPSTLKRFTKDGYSTSKSTKKVVTNLKEAAAILKMVSKSLEALIT